MKGELRPSKNRSYHGLQHLVPIFLFTDDSANELLRFLVWPLQRALGITIKLPRGCLPYSRYEMRSFPLRGVRVLHSAQYYLTR